MNEKYYEVLNAIQSPVKCLEDLKGKYLIKIEKTDDEMFMYLSDNQYVRFYHRQDCCENVYIADITGDLDDLVGEMLVEAEESSQEAVSDECSDSGTWTFYKFRTRKGSVVIRWLGESNGYYSESVDIDFVGFNN